MSKQSAKSGRSYGWHRDRRDDRDHYYGAVISHKALPPSVDLRPGCTPVYDQGSLGSCTANAIAAVFDFERQRQGLRPSFPSRLFIYYNERVLEHNVASDSGAQLRDGIKSIAASGVCSEDPASGDAPASLWPYDIAVFTHRPWPACYTDARHDRALQYGRVVQTVPQLKGCLADGHPFVFGFEVPESFESEETAKTGIMSMPNSGEQFLGGHAVACVGYDDARQAFLVRNSWSTGWGVGGHFFMPYAFMADPRFANDFWAIRLVGP